MLKSLRQGIRIACTLFLLVAAQQLSATNYWLEAECAEIGSRWQKVVTDTAAGGAFVVSQYMSTMSAPEDVAENRVRFTVEDAGAGLPFTLFARLHAPSPLNDSYWVRINEGPWLNVNYRLYREGLGLHWFEVTTTELVAGTNTIDFAYRESNTLLDKILLTDSGLVPTGEGPMAGSCLDVPDRPADPRLFWLEAECAEVGSAWTTEKSVEAGGDAYVVSLLTSPERRAPVDIPTSILKFSVNNPDLSSGRFSLWIRTKTDTQYSAAYFWGRVNGGPWQRWSSYPNLGVGWRWTRVRSFYGNLTDGENTIEIAYRGTGTRLDKLLLTNYPSFTPSSRGEYLPPCELTPPPVATDQNTFWLEAECGELGDKWSVEPNDAASGGLVAVERGSSTLDVPPADEPENLLRFTLLAADSGDYNLFGRILAPSGNDDSFWVRANGGDWFKWSPGIRINEGFVWNQIPTVFPLSAGTNTLDFAYREDGALLDKVVVTITSIPPRGEGESAANCSAPGPAMAASLASVPEFESAPAEKENSQVTLFPNPTTDRLTLRLDGPYVGKVVVVLTDLHGRRLREMNYIKYAGDFQEEVNVAQLPAGVYHLSLWEGDHHTRKPFVKR